MKALRINWCGVMVTAGLLGATATAWTQQNHLPSMDQQPNIGFGADASTGPGSRSRTGVEPNPLGAMLEEKQLKTRNSERQKRIQDDTAKLLALASELKQQVERPDKAGSPVEEVRKAEEIEKLAKGVKDRMRS